MVCAQEFLGDMGGETDFASDCIVARGRVSPALARILPAFPRLDPTPPHIFSRLIMALSLVHDSLCLMGLSFSDRALNISGIIIDT